ncbi:hypothetical protein ACI7RC_09600 [Brevibacillus sp. B_LB10_24]|uniref:hypothetical protein n=1 Tax=Brevibacillus sp. B_LB10_24 TaxID=3380645 RepID=UPI0038BB11FA
MNQRWKFNHHLYRIKNVCRQIIVPLIIFQFVRTIIFPTTFDVIILGLLAAVHLAITFDWI